MGWGACRIYGNDIIGLYLQGFHPCTPLGILSPDPIFFSGGSEDPPGKTV